MIIHAENAFTSSGKDRGCLARWLMGLVLGYSKVFRTGVWRGVGGVFGKDVLKGCWRGVRRVLGGVWRGVFGEGCWSGVGGVFGRVLENCRRGVWRGVLEGCWRAV